ncbi:MAG: DNA-3-methyladenine glycosylase 2 family protein [Verrucomicrobia bacterium]|nr:DNA-3-methyladenine glycosylase 2 family protein [Verrucomicrobiota bacterium]
MNEAAVQHLLRADKRLARIIKKVGDCPLQPRLRVSPYEALVRSVAYQQLNGTAAETILRRVIALFQGERFPKPASVIAASEQSLRSAGLSRAKTAAIKDIAAKTIEGIVPPRRSLANLTDAEIIERLTVVRGVGPWTVEMLLMFTLGRPDVLPATDYGVRSGFAKVYGHSELPHPRLILEHGERWRPHRTVASWYLWRALELE